ncbi:signal transducer and activator of transcription 5B [Chrysoperla carnea]|uniref:signal transducer and activator of transcription 5B n=1 Tax=Chrysoperla carnea TaxID=189513 RepID=UPI001D068032|nr:signal transducer and activator of transcription 5B [Chrysoperla carnea]
MAMWAEIQNLNSDIQVQIRGIYSEHFPIEVRHFLAAWLEDQMWAEVNPDNPQYDQYVAALITQFCAEIDMKVASMNNSAESYLAKMKLSDAVAMFRQKYSNNPGQLFNYIRQCLAHELKIVQAAGIKSHPNINIGAILGAIPRADDVELIQQLNVLKQRTSESSDDLKRIDEETEAFALLYHECTKIGAMLEHISNSTKTQQIISQEQTMQILNKERTMQSQKEKIEASLHQKMSHLVQMCIALGEKLKENVQILNTLQIRVLDHELIRWKRDQQLAGNGAPFNNNLDNIQEWCESLAELIWLNRQQIKEAVRLKSKLQINIPIDVLPELSQQITQLLSTLVTSTFIIEKQPPQVMKTNTRFTSTVRLLVGGKLNVCMSSPEVTVKIISESQAIQLLKSEKLGTKQGSEMASGEILNNTGTMEYQQTTKQLSVSFRNMQLKKIKRAEKKGTESVMDEKFSLLFQSTFTVGGGELVFQVWTLSLPVVVIVHGNQEPHAWATVTWDNAFAEPGRVPFQVPDKVPWGNVAEALSMKFRAATGKPLTPENLRFLGEKAFRNQMVDNNTLLSWAQFCKEPLTERNFTFWEWFYAVMKLTREHLRGPWTDGLIHGFVRKKQAEEMLASCQNGTFLLRFSDSELGGVTIAWVSDKSEVFMIQPFTSKDFGIRSLADRIFDLQQLMYLYPDICKDHAFGKYYTPYTDNPPANNGYVKPLLVTHVPSWVGGAGYSNPNTPQHTFAQSPDPSRDTPSVASSYMGVQSMPIGGANSAMLTEQPDYFEQIDFKDALDDFCITGNMYTTK